MLFETSDRGGVILTGQSSVPERESEFFCHYENISDKRYKNPYVVVKEFKVDFSRRRKNLTILLQERDGINVIHIYGTHQSGIW